MAHRLPQPPHAHPSHMPGTPTRSASSPALRSRVNTGQQHSRRGDEASAAESEQSSPSMYNVISNVKKRVSSNLEHYMGIGIPDLFRRRDRSRSGSRDRSYVTPPALPEVPTPIMVENHHGNGDVDDFVFVENIELNHMSNWIVGSERQHVTYYAREHYRPELGRGHIFLALNLNTPTWCDKCGDFIWGLYKNCLRCKHCQYTCHHKCRQMVTLDCLSVTDGRTVERPRRNQSETSLCRGQGQVDDADSGYHTGDGLQGHKPSELTLTRDELRKEIDAFNQNQHGLSMTLLNSSASFEGFIRVYMNLMRPISMTLPARPPSIYDVLTHEEDENGPRGEDTLSTSFYLPKDTSKVIHISSSTTTQEVIRALLHKYKITDNPRKFALYERTQEEGQKASMRRLADDEQPLPLCLTWKAEGLYVHRFVLQENDTGEILWEAFSVPELESFLRILNHEEEEYIDQLKQKFRILRLHIERRCKDMERERHLGEQDAKLCWQAMAVPAAPNNNNSRQDNKKEPVVDENTGKLIFDTDRLSKNESYTEEEEEEVTPPASPTMIPRNRHDDHDGGGGGDGNEDDDEQTHITLTDDPREPIFV